MHTTRTSTGSGRLAWDAMAGAAALLAMVLLAGCGGGGPAVPPEEERGQLITEAVTVAQMQADLAAVGKPLPDFLADGVITPTELRGETVTPASYMTVLRLGYWLYYQSCASRRVKWYECNLTSAYALTDVSLRDRGGDPDLYVFAPLRPNSPWTSLQPIGYSVGTRDERVGSFNAAAFGGTGKFIAAVYAYGSYTAYYDLRFW